MREFAVISRCRATLAETKGQKTRGAQEQRWAAVAQLGKLRHISTIPVLREIAQSVDEQTTTRRVAIRGIAETRDKSVFPIIIGLVDDPDPLIYSAAVGALRNLSGITLGNMAYNGPDEFSARRAEMQRMWQAWWDANHASYEPNYDTVFFHRN